MKSKKDRLKITLGNNLHSLRKERGQTQEQLAEELGISTSHYANIERGSKLPSAYTLYRIAHHFNVSIDSLCNDISNQSSIKNIETLLKNQPESVILKSEKMLRLLIEDHSDKDL